MKSPYIFLELYVLDLQARIDFFVKCFDAVINKTEGEDFAELYIGETRLLLNSMPVDKFGVQNPIRKQGALEHLGAGVEVGIWVQDLEAARAKVAAQNMPYISEIASQPWGARDFRFLLPEGYYVRVSTDI